MRETAYPFKVVDLNGFSDKDLTSYEQYKHIFLGNDRVVTKLRDDSMTESVSFFYHKDHLGSSSLMSDTSGSEYTYDEYYPYGSQWINSNKQDLSDPASGVKHYFTGHEVDKETQLYYMLARYYDPELGGFLSGDPAMESIDSYQYVMRNPLVYIDSNGQKFDAAAQVWADKIKQLPIPSKLHEIIKFLEETPHLINLNIQNEKEKSGSAGTIAKFSGNPSDLKKDGIPEAIPADQLSFEVNYYHGTEEEDRQIVATGHELMHVYDMIKLGDELELKSLDGQNYLTPGKHFEDWMERRGRRAGLDIAAAMYKQRTESGQDSAAVLWYLNEYVIGGEMGKGTLDNWQGQFWDDMTHEQKTEIHSGINKYFLNQKNKGDYRNTDHRRPFAYGIYEYDMIPIIIDREGKYR